MFTVAAVYNKKDYFERVLLDSLQKQTTLFELIPIDNTNWRYKSAAQAFNAEVRNPKGEYILFANQDVDFGDDTDWLRTAEEEARKLPDAGIMGVFGVDFEGNCRGYISDGGQKRVRRENGAVEVQLVDELLFIIPKKVFDTIKFDEATFDGWHLYGADYSMTVQQHGLKAYVIPAFVYHRSLRTNRADISKYKRRILLKYTHSMFTSIGVMNIGTINKKSFIKIFVQQLLSPIYTWLFPNWISLLQKEGNGFASILDLGCGYNSPVQHLDIPKKVGVELFDDYIEESRKKAIHQEYIRESILNVDFPQHSFDIVFASEVIEHLRKADGEKLLDIMGKMAAKKVIITTPNGFLPQPSYNDNNLEEHKSGWTVSDFKQRGFRVYGTNGCKFLRNPQGGLRYHRPFYFWSFLTSLSQKIAYFFPSLAFELFAVKDVT